MFTHIAVLAVSLAVLVFGADLLVRGAAGLAARLGVPSVVVALTVVAWGTSMPELVVSVASSRAGQPDVAVGNVIGSNIFNVLLILGISSLITPLRVHSKLIRLDIPLMILVSLAVWAIVMDLSVTRVEGALLLAMLVWYTWMLFRVGSDGVDEENRAVPGSLAKLVLEILIGLVLLVLGGRWMVSAAVSLAEHLGVSSLVIGLTIVAAGTSLPELATSAVAAVRGERDIAVGNVVGSNIFNLLAVLGSSAVISKGRLAVSELAASFDFAVMVIAALVCLPMAASGLRISRGEGAVLAIGYTIYVAALLLGFPSRLPWLENRTALFALLLFASVAAAGAVGLRARHTPDPEQT